MADNRRMAYKLYDVNAIPEDQLIPYEILLDYSNQDIITIDEKGNKVSLFEYIAEKTKDYLDSNHMILPNQHNTATEKDSGFMSPTQVKNLNTCVDISSELLNLLKDSQDNKKYTISNLNYTISGKSLVIDCTIKNGALSIIPTNNTITLGERPSSSFINAYMKIGYRDDLIAITDDDYVITLYENINYLDETTIVIDNITYNYDEVSHRYMTEDNQTAIIPLFRIRRRNDDLIADNNVLGKLSANSFISDKEISDIARREVPTTTLQSLLLNNIGNQNQLINSKIHSKILKTNVSRKVDNDAFLYLSLNKTDKDAINNQLLSKSIIYKKSPYGYMMRCARTKGNFINFNEVDDFTLEFMVDIESLQNLIQSEEIILLKDTSMNDILSINANKPSNNEVSLSIGARVNNSMSYNILSLNITDDRKYHMIKIVKTKEIVSVYVNEVFINRFAMDNSLAKYLQIPALSVALGEVMMTSNTTYTNSDINNNVYMIDNFTTSNTKDILIEHMETFTTTTLHKDSIDIEFDLANEGILAKGDSVYIYFNNEIVDQMVYTSTRILYCNGNVICLSENTDNYKKGDIIKIYKDNDNIENTYTIDSVEDNVLYLDKIVPNTFTNYNVSKIQMSVPAKLYINNQQVKHIIKDKYYIRAILDQDYPYNSKFSISFLERVSTDNTLERISDINSAAFADIYTSDRSNVLNILNKRNMTFTYNDNIISADLKKNPIAIINDDIEFFISFNIKDYMSTYSDKNTLMQSLKLVLNVEFSAGTNDVYLNNIKTNTEGYLINYVLSEKDLIIDDNFNVSLKISTGHQNKNGKLIIKDINALIYLDDASSFQIQNQYNQITDFAIISNDLFTVNSHEETQIFIEEKIDSYTVTPLTDIERLMVTEEVNGYALIHQHNILKLVHLEDGKTYNLDKYYVI